MIYRRKFEKRILYSVSTNGKIINTSNLKPFAQKLEKHYPSHIIKRSVEETSWVIHLVKIYSVDNTIHLLDDWMNE